MRAKLETVVPEDFWSTANKMMCRKKKTTIYQTLRKADGQRKIKKQYFYNRYVAIDTAMQVNYDHLKPNRGHF